MAILASVIVVTYNHKRFLDSCLNAILEQDYPHEVIVVDNCSSDGTPQIVKKNFPSVKLIESTENVGYGAGNNLGVKHAIGEYIVILNPDTIAENGWLRKLVKPLENDKKIITTSKILLYNGSAINTCGIINHFTGLPFTRGLGEAPEIHRELEYVSGFSGCCFAMKKKDFIKLGGFDENFFIYNEDSDLSWRAHLKRFRIMLVTSSIIKHDYTLNVSPEKIYHLEKNRYMLLRKYLSWTDFLLLLPSLITTEILTFGYAMKNGWKGLKYKCKAMVKGLSVNVNKMRGDKNNLFKSLSPTIPVEQLTYNKAEKVLKIFANKIFELNLKVVR